MILVTIKPASLGQQWGRGRYRFEASSVSRSQATPSNGDDLCVESSDSPETSSLVIFSPVWISSPLWALLTVDNIFLFPMTNMHYVASFHSSCDNLISWPLTIVINILILVYLRPSAFCRPCSLTDRLIIRSTSARFFIFIPNIIINIHHILWALLQAKYLLAIDSLLLPPMADQDGWL